MPPSLRLNQLELEPEALLMMMLPLRVRRWCVEHRRLSDRLVRLMVLLRVRRWCVGHRRFSDRLVRLLVLMLPPLDSLPPARQQVELLQVQLLL